MAYTLIKSEIQRGNPKLPSGSTFQKMDRGRYIFVKGNSRWFALTKLRGGWQVDEFEGTCPCDR